MSTHTFYGVVQYGITDRLSIRGKGGIGKIGADAYASMPVVPRDLSDLDYGLAWAAGLQFQICAPEEHGTSLALSGQFARMTPDDTAEPTTGDFFSDAEVTEITGALTVGVPHGRTRPYAGVVYSGLEYDLRVNAEPWTYEKPDHVGAVAGLDQVLGDRGWLNLEARFFDESSFSAILGLSW